MLYELYMEICLTRDIPGTIYKCNDLATIIDISESENKKTYTLEFFSSLGESLSTTTVSEDFIKPLSSKSIISMREF